MGGVPCPTISQTQGSPSGGLIRDAKGNLYGTTQNGGTASAGSAFELSPPQSGSSWTETILYSFQGGSDGYAPLGRMTLDKSGNLYGTTVGGGMTSDYCTPWQGCGTVFKLTHPSNGWSKLILHRFHAPPADGYFPSSALLLSGQAIYSTTTEGGTVSQDSYGTVFQIN